MKAVITADIVNSREVSPEIWLKTLKTTLQNIGEEYAVWEIFRGDSIQVIIQPKKALEVAVLLKSAIKQIPNIDIRIGIGIGEITYQSEKVTTSNGPAFVYAGEAFDGLKKNTLAIKTRWQEFDKTINIMLNLATLTMDYWKPAMAEIVYKQLENPESKQIEIAQALNKKQSNVSYSLKKAGYEEIQDCLQFYKQKIGELC
ncbi:SatD family protein [Wenyingzhuangia sp. chi5]|uniref:SatD family protein n=1 Tax=Wenyingzhuangia gilva TaxID=3057677 RepID=A0ABT8VSG0_9FLAO|nr:SatD family protein [Wenyingzhuangia sp. chi5]MDO3694877.1 SatD family protein [Wenyingzhuangia sp. chi5]